ncbi:MAG TPA: LacI family DNA-binding transcriptional regulator [Steroidobacteraceae bacterium]|nr:LacI family DNA-binding transcriptional regulator [Steroidobacteraceae bacterium]
MTKSSARAARRKSEPTSRGGQDRSGAPYDGRRPTINDIARLADVSKKTVSRVINESPAVRPETRAKVVSLIKQFGYMPDPQARGLAFRKSFLIGLVYDNPNAQYIVNIQEGALDAMRGSGYELVVHPCDRKSADFIPGVRHFVERQKLRGVILLPPIAENPKLARALDELGCDYVRIASVHLDEHARMIVSNDRRAAAEAARYLESLGHRRIAIITGPDAYRSAHERRAGFLTALEERGVKLPAAMIMEGGYTFESGVTCAETLLAQKPRPTAIFAANDEMAAGIYRVAYRMGLTIPGDLSVVGYDDSPVASRLWPSLTTIRLPIRDMGKLAASKLLGESDGPAGTPAQPTIVEAHLVVRDSCQSPRQPA